jgi:predicted adenylyl cyclase CyaB
MRTQDFTEFEAKFYPVDKEKYRNKLKALDAKLITPERQMVRMVADYRENTILGHRTCIRVRDEGDAIRLSLKVSAGGNGKLTDQKEIDIEVSDFDKTVKIFEAAGIKFNRYQKNLRETWKFDGVEITIDTWPGLETFTEIEASSEKRVKEVADKLGFDWNKKLIVPASDVYVKVYGISLDEAFDKIANITFENNPFKGMKKVWP